MRISRLVPIGLAVLAAALALWLTHRAPKVATVLPRRGDVAEIVYASGVVEPKTWAKVTSLVRERIVWTCNCEAQTVEAGALLARLDDSEANAALKELEARLTLAQENFTRLSTLLERHVSSQQAVDQSRAEVAQLDALIAGQKAKLDSYVLRAPSAGVVLRRDGEVGEIAEPGAVLFWVGQPSPLLVVADVNEEDIPRVTLGQRVLLRSDAFRGQVLEGAVDSVTPKGDPVTKTYRVRVALPADTPLRIGMSTDVNIVTRVAGDALLVPSLAIRGDRLFIADGNRARERTFEAGIRGLNDVQILSGIGTDARVISPFPDTLADGGRVKVEGK